MRSLVATTAVLAGCLGPLSLPSFPDSGPRVDARPPLPVVSIDVRDARGDLRPLGAIPRLPRVRVTRPELDELAPDGPTIFLYRGTPDEIRDDLDAKPLRASTLERVVRTGARHDEDGALVLVPEEPLLPGESITIAVAAWARLVTGESVGRGTAVAARVSSSPMDGAQPVATWPADGTDGVPVGLGLAVVRFDGDVEEEGDGVALLAPDLATVPAAVSRAPCAMLGFRDAPGLTTVCVTLRPDAPLAPHTTYALVTRDPLVDRTGAALSGLSARFTTETSPGETPPPELVSVPCGLDETSLDTGAGTVCVLADDRSVSVRGQSSLPARVFLASPSTSTATVAMDGAFALRLSGLRADADLPVALALVDAAERRTTPMLDLHTTPPLATLSITEVRADPRGPDPSEEYVELWNFGDAPVDVAGFTLADRDDAMGDALLAPRPLPAGARALVVADSFVPDDGVDDPAPAGALLVRAGPTLGSGGLPARGATLFLRDGTGRRLSAAPALATPEGTCLARVTDDPRDGSPVGFVPGATCTPAR